MNHIMYADDICVMAPTAIALQKLLEVCLGYTCSITNDLLFNPAKSVCIVLCSEKHPVSRDNYGILYGMNL